MIILIIVASPIGKVPKKRDWAGCRIIACHIRGYSEYRSMDTIRNMLKSKTFSAKMTTEIQ
jgi:hypothetical protein